MTDYLDHHVTEVRRAADRIRPHIRRTPTLRTDLDADLRLKPECFQVTGSFKTRGAFNAVLSLVGRDARPAGVIAVSSGNHAQALALAAATVGLPALIIIPEDANPAKVAATRALGAEVVQEGVTFGNRELRMRELMAERGVLSLNGGELLLKRGDERARGRGRVAFEDRPLLLIGDGEQEHRSQCRRQNAADDQTCEPKANRSLVQVTFLMRP